MNGSWEYHYHSRSPRVTRASHVQVKKTINVCFCLRDCLHEEQDFTQRRLDGCLQQIYRRGCSCVSLLGRRTRAAKKKGEFEHPLKAASVSFVSVLQDHERDPKKRRTDLAIHLPNLSWQNAQGQMSAEGLPFLWAFKLVFAAGEEKPNEEGMIASSCRKRKIRSVTRRHHEQTPVFRIRSDWSAFNSHQVAL